MTRILVMADTHAPSRRLPDWLIRLAGRADMILHAGDLCDLETYETLFSLAPLYAVRGNNDRGFALPQRLLLTVEGVGIGVVHGDLGTGRTTAERALRSFPESPPIVVFGHSHERMQQPVKGVLLLNPGSPTKPRGGHPSALWLHVEDGRWQSRVASDDAEG